MTCTDTPVPLWVRFQLKLLDIGITQKRKPQPSCPHCVLVKSLQITSPILPCALGGLPLPPRGPCLKGGQQPSPAASLPLSPETMAGSGEELGLVFLLSVGGVAGRGPPRASVGKVHGGQIWMEGVVFNISHPNSGLLCFVS